jgi:hypothetical protein
MKYIVSTSSASKRLYTNPTPRHICRFHNSPVEPGPNVPGFDITSKDFLEKINEINDKIITIRREITRLDAQRQLNKKTNRVIEIEIDELYTTIADIKEKIHQRDIMEMYCEAYPEEPECKIYEL